MFRKEKLLRKLLQMAIRNNCHDIVNYYLDKSLLADDEILFELCSSPIAFKNNSKNFAFY